MVAGSGALGYTVVPGRIEKRKNRDSGSPSLRGTPPALILPSDVLEIVQVGGR